MRPEDQNPLDLNNLPDDYYSRDGKKVLEDASSDYCRKKKSGGKDGKEECGKVYECRFCSLKFCKSQALGGHMNRHRQERETETLNHARQLVFRNDHSIVAVQGQVAPHLGCCNNAGGDPTMSLRFPRYLSAASSSSSSSQASQSTYLYTSSFASHYPVSDYYMGHGHALHNHSNYLGSSSTPSGESGYTCIGAPVGHGGFGGGDDGSLLHSHGYSAPQHRLDPPSAINRFHDGF